MFTFLYLMIQAIFFLDRIVIKFFNPLPFLIHFSTGESNIIYKNNEMSSGDFYLLKMFKVMNFFLSVYALSTPFTQSFSEFEHQWKFKKKRSRVQLWNLTFFFHYQDVGTGFSSSLTARDNNKVLQAFLITSSSERCNIFDVNLSSPSKAPRRQGDIKYKNLYRYQNWCNQCGSNKVWNCIQVERDTLLLPTCWLITQHFTRFIRL